MNAGTKVRMLFDGFDAQGRQRVYSKGQEAVVVSLGTMRRNRRTWATVVVRFHDSTTAEVLRSAVESTEE